jgi:hypothetical protein
VARKSETFVIHNPDGSISLDAYAGMSRDELKTRCGELCRELNEWHFIAMELFDGGKDSLSPAAREKVERLVEAYKD